MTVRFLFVLLISSISFFSFSQGPGTIVSELNRMEEPLLSDLILVHINKVRDTLNSKKLMSDKELSNAADIQVKYCKKNKKLSHNHSSKKLKKVRNRVDHSHGIHEMVGENLIYIGFDTKELQSYNSLAVEIVEGWVNSPGHFKNLKNPDYSRSGIAISIDKKTNRIYAAQVFGSTPLEIDGFKTPTNAYNISNDYNNQKCKDCRKIIDTIYSIGGFVENDIVYLSVGRGDRFMKAFKGNYYITADVILKRQFACDDINQLHSSRYHDGYLMKPVPLKKILKGNLFDDVIYAPIGELPFSINEQFEVNIMILNKPTMSRKKNLCISIYPSPLYGHDLKLMRHTSLIDTNSNMNDFLLNRTLKFEIPFEKNKFDYTQEDIQPMIDSLSLNKFSIQEIKLRAYSSVEGSKENNIILQNKRAKSIVKSFQSFQLDSIETRIRSSENWKGFRRDVKKTSYSYLAKLSKDEVKKELEIDSVNKELESVLAKHRKAIVIVDIQEKMEATRDIEQLIFEFQNELDQDKVDEANLEVFQGKIHAFIIKNDLDLSLLNRINIPLNPEYLPFLMNDVTLRYELGDIVPPMEELLLLAKSASKRIDFLFDIHGYMLQHWYKKPLLELEHLKVANNAKLLIQNKGVEIGEYYKMMLNYHICLANYYSSIKDYEKEKKATRYVFRYYKKATLRSSDALILANYLVNHKMVTEAAKLLRPYTNKSEVSKDVLFYYLSVAIFTKFTKNDNDFDVKMKQALDLDGVRFCELFGYPALSFQLMRNRTLKKYFCDNCQDIDVAPSIESIIGDDQLDPKLLKIPISD